MVATGPGGKRSRSGRFFRGLGVFLLLAVLAVLAAGAAVLLDRELRPAPPAPAVDPELFRELQARLVEIERGLGRLDERIGRLERAQPAGEFAAEPVTGLEPQLALLDVQTRLLKALVEGAQGNRGRATRELGPVESGLGKVASLSGVPPAWRDALIDLQLQVARAQLELAAGRPAGLDRLELVWRELTALTGGEPGP